MKIKLLLLLAFLAVPSFVFAAGQAEPTIYVIKQGDTLWGLSGRFIKDPYYWPDMWAKNGQVTNPHFIYPGQKVRVFPDHLELVSAEQAVAPAQKSAPAETDTDALQDVAAEKTYTLYGTEGFLAEEAFKPYGSLIGVSHDRIVSGVDDTVYTDIGSDRNAHSGDKFSVFFKDAPVKDPLTDEELGTKMIPVGTIQLTDLERKSSRAIVTKSSREIGPGTYLLPYKESVRREIALKNSTVDLKGCIVESYSGVSVIAAGDVVYINIGATQGVEVGNMLYVVRDVTIDPRTVEGRIGKLPQELLGALVVLETGNKTATALVVKSIDAIYKGDRIVSQTK